MVSTNDVLIALAAGLGAAALLKLLRLDGNNSVLENQVQEVVSNTETNQADLTKNAINEIDKTIEFLQKQISKAREITNPAPVIIGARGGGRLNQKAQFKTPQELGAVNKSVIDFLTGKRENLTGFAGLQAQIDNIIQTQRAAAKIKLEKSAASDFIKKANEQISLLTTKRQELSV